MILHRIVAAALISAGIVWAADDAAHNPVRANLLQMPISGGGGVSCSGAGLTAYNNLATNLGGSLDTAHQNFYKALICGPSGLVTTGEVTGTLAGNGTGTDNCGSLFDVWYVLGTDTSAHALTNICGDTARNASVVGSPVFTANTGYAGVPNTGYLTSNYTPSTNATNYAQNSASEVAWSLSALGSTTAVPGGVTNPTGHTVTMNPKFTDNNFYCSINDNNTDTGAANAGDTNAMFACDRSGASAGTAYICTSGGCTSNHSLTTSSVTVPADPYFITSFNSTGTPIDGWSGNVLMVILGAHMTATNYTHIHDAVCAAAAQISATWAGC